MKGLEHIYHRSRHFIRA